MHGSRQRTSPKVYLVVRGGRCLSCRPHGWRAFRDPEERDRMPPCVRVPIYRITARTKADAVRLAQTRFAAETQSAARRPAHSGGPDARARHQLFRPTL
jgi:hypothetical protein